MIVAVKNAEGNFDLLSNGNQLGEITILGTWTGEALFEHTSRELLDLSDMARICHLMEMCSMYPDKGEIE